MHRVLSFDKFRLDPGRRCLFGPEGEISLRQKNFEVLHCLLRHGGTVVHKRHLLDSVWQDVAVTEESLTKCISEIRAALGSRGQSIIRTVARQGYRVATPVLELEASQLGATNARRPPLSLVVLPFMNMSGDGTRDYLADGITEDLTSDLARIGSLFVIARNTAFTYKTRKINFREIGAELGVRFAIEGSVREVGDRLRINVQLIDVDTTAHLWAVRLDIDRAELSNGLDDVVLGLANALGVTIVAAAAKTRSGAPPDALDYILRARAALNAPVMPSQQYFVDIRALYSKALEMDAKNPDALVGRAHIDVFEFSVMDTDVKTLEFAESLVDEALKLEPAHALGRYTRAYIYSMTRRMVAAKFEAEMAIVFDPTMVNAYARLAQIENFSGNPTAALGWIGKVKRISPKDRFVLYWEGIEAHARVLLCEDAEAVRICRKLQAAGYTPKFIYYFLIASLAHLGRELEAKAALTEFISRYPRFATMMAIKAAERSLEPAFLQRRERLYEGLRKAGLAEEIS